MTWGVGQRWAGDGPDWISAQETLVKLLDGRKDVPMNDLWTLRANSLVGWAEGLGCPAPVLTDAGRRLALTLL